MKWIKKGKIFDSTTFDLSWYKKNSMVPTPYLLNKDTIRIFVTMCDEQNVGRIGYVDVDVNDPSKIVAYSKEPLIDIGEDGAYDDNGVVTSALLEDEGKIYMYFSGYEKCVKIPYRIFCGVAISEDNGDSFKKLNTASILPPIDEEIFNRCAPYVIKEDNIYKLYYLADTAGKWNLDPKGKKVPMYTLKYLEGTSVKDFPLTEGKLVLPFKNDNECGITLPNIWKEDGLYKMVYSIRTLSEGYYIGYAESENGIDFVRKDEEIDFQGEALNWDKEMMCFAKLLHLEDKIYMFYSGNHYGMAGVGYAVLNK